MHNDLHYISKRITIFLMVLFSVLTAYAKAVPYFQFDLGITQRVQMFNPDGFDFLMKFLSGLGSSAWPVIITLALCTIYTGLGKKKDSILIGISFVGTSLISVILKFLVDRPRPTPDLILQLTDPATNPSFPSAHVLFAIGVFGFVSFLIFIEAKKGWVKNVLLGVLFSSIILMGVSRVYLGMHWFSDVLGSYLIGTVWLYFMSYLYRKLS